MRPLPLIVTFVALASILSAQRLERLREVLPWDDLFGSDPFVADIDGDGLPDLAGTSRDPVTGVTITIWRRNDGAGHFGAGQEFVDERLTLIQIGDYTGDGLPDVIAEGSDIGNDICLFVQGPPGVFTEDPAAFPVAISRRLFPLDLEGDGDLDLFDFNGTSTFLLRNDGSGRFEDVTALLPAGSDAFFGVVFDAEGDGDDDVLVGNPVRLLRNDGAGGFRIENQSLHILSGIGFQAADVDGDGDPDMVLTSGNWARNDGSGAFTGQGFFGGYGSGALVDFDGDGRVDVVRPVLNLDGLEALRGVEPTSLVPLPSAVLDRFSTQEVNLVSAADFDGDGDVDLLVSADRWWLVWGDGAGGWELALATPERIEESFEGLYVNDLDGDGTLDGLGIAADGLGERFVWWRGLGGGAFAAPLDVSPTDEWTGAAAIDLENDGTRDALLVSESEARAYRFDATAPWTPALNAVSVAGGNGGPTVADVLVGDLNADGFEDAVVLCTRIGGAQTPDYVLFNDGAGELVDAAAGLPINLFRGDLGDLDLDGDLDFVALTNAETRTYLNRGDGVFDIDPQVLPLMTIRASLRLADVDASGTLDLALGLTQPSRAVELYEGLGDGTFASTPAVSLPRQGAQLLPTWIATPDVDGDGLPELYLPDGSNGTFYANRGGFVFDDLSAAMPPITANTRGLPVAWGDLDADGDDDVWVPGETQVLWSLQRQLSWATWPRYGKPLRMELAGSPNGFWGLYASPATASIPSPLGLFLLDPAQGVALGSGLLDGNGDAAASFAVPAEVSLVSPVLYWQGLVGTPLRFTNLETTAFSVF